MVRGKYRANTSPHRAARAVRQPPKEKCDENDRANEPKPPRVTPPDSEAVPDDELLDAESPPKKLLRRDQYPPWPPPDEDPPEEHAVLVCGNDGAAMPGDFGTQSSRVSA